MDYICINVQSSGLLVSDEVVHMDAVWSDGRGKRLRLNWSGEGDIPKEEIVADFCRACDNYLLVDYDHMSFRFLQVEAQRQGIKLENKVCHLQPEFFELFPGEPDYSLDAMVMRCGLTLGRAALPSEKIAGLYEFLKT